jgi:uncharacterized membrane protein YuzA (DUF378 family)
MRALHVIAFVLLVVGGLNWGLTLVDMDIANWGLPSGLVDTIYGLVALSAVYIAATHGRDCKTCKGEAHQM